MNFTSKILKINWCCANFTAHSSCQRSRLPTRISRPTISKKSGHIGDLITLDLQQIFVAGKNKKLINEAHQRLQEGLLFDAVNELYHDQQSSTTMTGVQLKELSPILINALRSLQEGQFSPPLETEAGQHIFYVVKRRVSVDTAFAASKDELELELKQLELANQTRVWLQKQRAETNIKLLYQ